MTCKLLLVDDEALALQLLQKNLSRRAYDVACARNGAEALELLDDSYEVMVTDLVMPQVDGIALLDQAKQRFPNLLAVAMTSFADKERAIAALNAGADYLLEKPFTADELYRLLGQLRQRQVEHVKGHISGAVSQRLHSFGLSPAEEQVVIMILQGLANKQIASELGIREQSVKNRISSVYSKLRISGRSELFHLLFPLQPSDKA